MLNLEPIAASSDVYCKYKFAFSVAFEDSACALVEVQNDSETCNMLVSASLMRVTRTESDSDSDRETDGAQAWTQ